MLKSTHNDVSVWICRKNKQAGGQRKKERRKERKEKKQNRREKRIVRLLHGRAVS